MGDVDLKCPKCGQELRVSEFAETVTCSGCGEAVKGAQTDKEKPQRKLRLKPQESPAEDEGGETPPPSEDERQFELSQKRPKSKLNREGAKQTVVAVLLFVTFGLVSGGVRWGNTVAPRFFSVPPTYVETVQTYGPYLFLALHVVILLLAFKDAVFSGILSLLVPPYAYYYLFFVCDNFFVRAILAGIYVGIGFDSVLFVHEHLSAAFGFVNGWIQTGGGG